VADEDASLSNLPYYADEHGIDEEARARPRAIANLSEQEQMVEYRRRIDRYWLRDAAQLPELEGRALRFVWDIVIPLKDLNTNTISIDNRVIWREPVAPVNAARFDAVRELLKERYGKRFKGLTQTDRRRDHY
jgi:hypothetical protein